MLSSWWTYSPSAPWLYILHSSIIGASAKGHYLCVFVRMHVGIDVSGVCYRFLSNHHWAPRCRSLSRFLVWWGKTGEDMSCGENKNFRCWAVCKMAVPQCAMAVSIVRQPRTQLQWKVLSGKKSNNSKFFSGNCKFHSKRLHVRYFQCHQWHQSSRSCKVNDPTLRDKGTNREIRPGCATSQCLTTGWSHWTTRTLRSECLARW